MQLQLIAADAPKVVDAPKITDWLTVIVATIGVGATVGVGIIAAVFTAGYRMRRRALCDPDKKVSFEAFNSGRIRGEISCVEFVIRASWGVRMIRWLLRKNEFEPILAVAEPAGRQVIEPGETREWRIDVPDLEKPRTLPPTLRHPLRVRPKGPVKPRQLVLRVGRGLYRPRYLRYQRLLPFRRIRQLSHRLAEPTGCAATADTGRPAAAAASSPGSFKPASGGTAPGAGTQFGGRHRRRRFHSGSLGAVPDAEKLDR
jgi:hypothetical protein